MNVMQFPVVVLESVRPDVYFTGRQVATAVGISTTRLNRLVGLGLVESVGGRPGHFTATAVVRLRRMLRLHDDLGVNLCGAAIIVDLVERLDRVER